MMIMEGPWQCDAFCLCLIMQCTIYIILIKMFLMVSCSQIIMCFVQKKHTTKNFVGLHNEPRYRLALTLVSMLL